MSNIYPITFTLTNIFKIISYMSPFLLSLTMILFSILSNKIVQGLVLLVGIVIVTFINYLLKNIIKSKQDLNASPFCNVLSFPFTYRDNESIYDSPSLSTTVLTFILSYLIFPMFTNNDKNYSIIIVGLIFICINASVEFIDKCSQLGGIILGFIIGLILGVLYYNLIVNSGYKDIAYFNKTISNNTQCSKPGPTKFKCTKYVRGDRDKKGNYVAHPISQIEQSGNLLNVPNTETGFQMTPIWADIREISGNFFKIRTNEKGMKGKQEAKHISNLLKCNDPIEDNKYIHFGYINGRQNDLNNHYEFIVDCSRNDTRGKAEKFINIITGNNAWQSHKDIRNDILSNIGKPQLDLVKLYQYENTNRTPINYYLIPGAADNVVCDSLAQEIGCSQCISTNLFKTATSYNVALNLLYEDPDTRTNSFVNNPNLNQINSVKSAGWGLTYCPTTPSKNGWKVYTHEINMNAPNEKYGLDEEITNNRYAYWLKTSNNDEIEL